MQRRSPQSRRKRSSQEEGTESVSDVAQQVVLERATPVRDFDLGRSVRFTSPKATTKSHLKADIIITES
ncbi:hypothetical protein Aperf_G00000070099 [Anoplocephala perfoliata]